jgi:hypothetical protein
MEYTAPGTDFIPCGQNWIAEAMSWCCPMFGCLILFEKSNLQMISHAISKEKKGKDADQIYTTEGQSPSSSSSFPPHHADHIGSSRRRWNVGTSHGRL